MTAYQTTEAYGPQQSPKRRRFWPWREVTIWLSAWQEYNRIQNIDPYILEDIGMSEADRSHVSVAEIARRIRTYG